MTQSRAIDAGNRPLPPDRVAARPPPGLALAAAILVVSVPLLVALIDVRSPPWHPVADWAQLELRVRDVALTHPPLVGLPGRLHAYGQAGSHPGPVAFYALAPLYRLLGGSSFALAVSTAVLNVVAVSLSLWIGMRRGSTRGLFAVAAVLALLIHAYGAERLVVPWNVWLPMLWWVVFLLAVWSVACDDLPMLPVAALAGSFCVQTHISYAGTVGGIALVVAGWLAVRVARGQDPLWSGAAVRWGAVAAGMTVALWVPVLIDEAVNEPGNLSIIVKQFTEPVETTVGLRHAVDGVLTHLDPASVLSGAQNLRGPWAPGLIVLCCWMCSVVAALALRHRTLIAFHAVVALALLLGLVSMSRVLGTLLPYLVLWSWGTTALLLGAVTWTAAVQLARWRGAPTAPRWQLGVLGIGVAVVSLASTLDPHRADTPFPGLSYTLDRAVPALVTAIRAGDVVAPGARYTVSWEPDALFAWLVPYGLVLELDRAGIRASMTPEYASTVGRHRTAPVDETDAQLIYVTGADAIARWRTRTDAREITFVPAPAVDTAELAASRDYAVALLRTLGLGGHAAMVDTNVWGLSLVEDLPPSVKLRLDRMLQLSQPAAVFAITSR